MDLKCVNRISNSVDKTSNPVNDILGQCSEVQILGYFEEYNFHLFLKLTYSLISFNQGSYGSDLSSFIFKFS